MTDVRRVYHPTLNSFHDVKASDADKWKKAGWRLTAPNHVDESDAPAVGEGRGPVDIAREVPVLEDTSTTTTGTATGTGASGS
jgi:hypothetical protein